jgi:hypothetical protein
MNEMLPQAFIVDGLSDSIEISLRPRTYSYPPGETT